MQRVKRRIFSGAVCEQEVFNISDRLTDIKKAEPRPRFKTEEEREQHRIGISRRKHARLVNENFSPRSLYSTLTLDNENEVHTFKEAKRIRDLFVRRLKYAFPDAVIFIYLFRTRQEHEQNSRAYAFGRRTGRSDQETMDLRKYRPDRPSTRTQLLRRRRSRTGLHGACELPFRPLDTGAGRTPLEADAQRAEAGTGNADRCEKGLHREQAAAPAEGLYISRNEKHKAWIPLF